MNRDKYSPTHLRPKSAGNIVIVTKYIDPSYRLIYSAKSEATDTGLVNLFSLSSDDDSFPNFAGRWDMKENAVDVDLIAIGKRLDKQAFIAERDGYRGHHSVRDEGSPNTFRLHIEIPDKTVFCGLLEMDGTGAIYLRDTIELSMDG